MARAALPTPGPLVRAALLPAALALAAALALPVPAQAQAAPPSTPEAYRDDVASVDAIIHALYDVISGPVGEARDWDRFRALFIPGARLIPTGRNGAGAVVHRVMTADEYARNAGPNLEAVGFREHEIARRTDAFGHIVHVFSTYEGFRRGETEPYLRGINSIQLLNDGERWWIVTVFWSPETEEHPLPEGYLPGPGRN
jgi:hypothetical protein